MEAATERQENGTWLLVVNKQVDYELLTSGRFTFTISNRVSVILSIRNIDDVPPVILPITVSCEIEVTKYNFSQ